MKTVGEYFKERGEAIPVDYELKSSVIKRFAPVVFQDGDSYCAIFGNDPQDGIFGCGSTIDEALEDWEKHYNESNKL